ncbi:MAG: HD domain-containing protein [Thermodesulfobacteriaceae bacterium]|nr:HD domain-containing protein [Thermodesulfobacteriaceae bacterium]
MFYELDPSLRTRFFSLLDLSFSEKEKVISFLGKFKNRKDFFLVGGAVRDLILNKKINDLDLIVREGLEALVFFARSFLNFYLVSLAPEWGIYRLTKDKFSIDFTDFKGKTLEEDLRARDFTFNAMAIPVKGLFEGKFFIIDPFSGLKDLKERRIKILGERNLLEDPLRILRGYRFFAQNLGNIERETRNLFKKHKKRINLCASERILTELSYLLLSSKTYQTFLLMDEDGILEEIFPELSSCKGIPQPTFHHLDVYGHLLETLKWAEEILKNPESYLEISKGTEFEEDFIVAVKLASLFHDLGKAHTFKVMDRITFYGHEKVSAELFKNRAEILKFKKSLINRVVNLIRNHMRPFHLLNEKEEGKLTVRAKRNLIRDVPNLEELFIVCMADSLASRGPDKEEDYEERLKNFFKELLLFKKDFEKEIIKKRLITGDDLIALGFKPGPIFKEILQEVEILQMEKRLNSKEEALNYILGRYRKFLQKSI